MHQLFQERICRATAAASGRWRDIFIGVGVDAQLVDGKARPCPLCGGRDRFVFDDKYGRGDYFCRQCGPGDGLALVRGFLECKFTDALDAVESFCGLKSWDSTIKLGQTSLSKEDQTREIPQEKRHRIEMMEIWAQAHPIKEGDPVYKYLINRGLDPAVAGFEVRFHEKLSYHGEKGLDSFFPAMVSRVVDQNGCVVNLHRTYLTKEGFKAPIDKVKKLMPSGGVRGACVRFGVYPTEVLNLAEGIETALAVAQITREPTWATLGCTNLKNLENIPETVKRVNIFADNDKNFAGQAAAYLLAHRLSIRGFEVAVHVARHTASDWLDEALEKGLL